MNRATVMRAVRRVGLRVIADDMHGIVLRRAGFVAHNGVHWYLAQVHGTWLEEKWRLQCGGGIAGNGGVWWLEHLGGPTKESLGPFQTSSEFQRELRCWRDWEV